MRPSTLLLGLALFAAAPLSAQRATLPSSPSGKEQRTVAPLPAARGVSAGLNPATELIAKRRRLGIDETTVGTLRALETTYNEARAERLQRYDSLRAQVQMSRNRMQSGVTPATEERQISRERTIVLVRVMAELRSTRAAQVAETIAAIPEEKRAMAEEMLNEQADDLARTLRRAGPEGSEAAGPSRRP